MATRLLVAALAVLSSVSASTTPSIKRSYESHDYYALHIDPATAPSDVASHFGFELDGQVGDLEHHYLFKAPKHTDDVVKLAVQQHKRRVKRDPSASSHVLSSVLLAQKQHLRPPHQKRVPPPFLPDTRTALAQSIGQSKPESNDPAVIKGNEIALSLGIADPIYSDQWHLYNSIQKGHDINVTGVWLQGITGKNTTVCIVDDGLDFESEDLASNYFAAGSWDFNDRGPDPKPRLSDDRHGTRCAGEVAAAKNDVCGVGVAYDARIAGIRILSAPITDAEEASAMTYGLQDNDIYSCSWGPPDNGQEMGEPGILIKRAMLTAIQKGRAGLGTIYVFAAGNGAMSDDNCNFDGYTNSIYSITVGAIDRKGLHPYYSERCSAQLVVTYSSGSGDAIHTTDVGARNCYPGHGGTSAAGPLAAGIFALVLQVRPDFTWRDMQHLAVQTAVTLDVGDDWQNTTIGRPFSHQFGYGKLDAWRTVEAAKTFKKVKPQSWFFTPWQHIRHEIPQGQLGLSHSYTVSKEMLQQANFERVEHITVTMNVNHTRRGDLSVELRSPEGIVSHLSTTRSGDHYRGGYEDWTFMSVAHWGESGVGNWTIVVKDTVQNEFSGELIDWKLNLFGEAIDAASQKLLPLPNEHDDDDHDREKAVPITTSVTVPSTTQPTDAPTDLPDRPVRPSAAAEPTGESAVVTTTAAFEAPSRPTATGAPKVDSPVEEEPEMEETDPSADSNFLPSPFPTFGVSKRSQAWIYGALVLIVLFCVGLGAWFWFVKRRERRQAHEEYDFEVLDGDDDDDDAEGTKGSRRKGKKRAGELYDAFAGESDEDLFSDDEKYTDRRSQEKQPLSSDSDEGASRRPGPR